MAQPVVGSNADGRLEVFAIGADGALWHIWQWRPGGDWSEWASFGGSFDPAGDTGLIRPAVGTNADGRLEVFLRSPDGRLWHTWQLAPNDGWSALEPFPFTGGLQSAPAVVSNADGRLEVFMVGDLGGLWHIWQLAPNDGWSPLTSLLGPVGVGGLAGLLTAGRNEDGRLEVFATAEDTILWHIWQTVPNNGWDRWYPFGRDSTTCPTTPSSPAMRTAAWSCSGVGDQG